MLRRLLSNRFLLPTAVLLVVGLGSVLGLAPGAAASQGATATAPATTAGTAVASAGGVTAAVTPAVAAPETSVPAQYTVVAGDTLWSIADRLYADGAEWSAIAQANLGRTMAGGTPFTDPSLILPGWVLALPRPAATAGPAAPAAGTTAELTASESATGGRGSAARGSAAKQAVTLTPAARNAAACKREIDKIGYAGPANSGSPTNATKVTCAGGRLQSYGSSAITYRALPKSYVKAGEALFEQYCSSCHEADAQGGSAAPSLIGVGAATVHFWVSTGRMPAATPLSTQAQTKPPRLDDHQAKQIAAFITFLSPAAPFIPTVHLKQANLATGASLFALNCAACHTVTGMGDELAYGTNAPSLHHVTPTQVAEAIRTGPANMPRFTGNLSDSQVRDVVAYVTEKIQHPSNPGGFGLGGIGPVAEGFVALLFGVGGLMLVCFWIGDRS